YLDDLVDAVLRLTENDCLESGIWNICAAPETAVSVLDLASMIQQCVNPNMPPKFNFVPYSMFGLYEDVRHRSGSAAKAKLMLGWEAKVGLNEGLMRSIDALLKERKP
ncbi:MAG: NAD-dependent epimerase/dehydratase family protein, partial [Bacteroidia bacterium]